MKSKKRIIIIICVSIIITFTILLNIEISAYGLINWNFHYVKNPESKLIDSGILKNGFYEKIGVIEIDNNNVLVVYHIELNDNESDGVLIAHMKKNNDKYVYLGYYQLFTPKTSIDNMINSKEYINIPRINKIFYSGSIEYMGGYGIINKDYLPENDQLFSYRINELEFNIIYHLE